MHVIDITLNMVDSVAVSVETEMNFHNNLQLLQKFLGHQPTLTG
jgi:hypothetical protein